MHETFESLWVTEWLGWGDGLLISYSENAFQISKLDQDSGLFAVSPIIHDTFGPVSSNASWNWLSEPPSASRPAGANPSSEGCQPGHSIRTTLDPFCSEVQKEEFVRYAMCKSLQLQAIGLPHVLHALPCCYAVWPQARSLGSYLAPCFRRAMRRGLPRYRRGRLPISDLYWHCPMGHFRSIWCPVATGAER